MNAALKNILFLIASTLVGAVLMYGVYRGFDFATLGTFFSKRSNYVWVVAVLAVGILANIFRSLRWHMLLEAAHIKTTRRRAIELMFISYLINSITPRLGELTRSLLVKRGDAKVSTRAFGTVVIEKAADIVCLVLVVGLTITLRWHNTVSLVHNLTEGLTWMVPNYGFYIAIGCGVCLLIGLTFKLWWKHVHNFIQNLWVGISAVAHLKSPLCFSALCLAIWTCNFLQLYLLVPCFSEMAAIGLADTLHVFAATSVGVLLPTPAGAGPWHFAIVKTLTTVYGIAKSVAQSYALITHGLKTVLVMLLGVLGYASYYREVWLWMKRKKENINQ